MNPSWSKRGRMSKRVDELLQEIHEQGRVDAAESDSTEKEALKHTVRVVS